ncbi:replication protein [Shouchella clausii]|uniref:conserved phage C-terminal domain-containing protein n=1 Tax=Shouchella clausii TaxID=79880 RepID=UPI000BA5D69C|nr:conserved phage C-terminal domain-containing protein [Shouchella clausii]PAF08695.1 replication protein [Shouchella clausii]
MAKYRNVRIDFWQDGFVLDLTPEEKFFYLYLMTNSKTTQCGIYELPLRIIETETGYNRETVQKLIDRFVEYDKVAYNCPTKEIILLNWAKYNFINSPKVTKLIQKELESVKYQPFVQLYLERLERYGYPTDTLSIDHGEELITNNRELINKKENVVEIVNYLNAAADKNFSPSSKKTNSLINNLFKEGYTLEDFKNVIDKKTKQWKNDPKMDNYLRPITLFAASNFESYLNEKGLGVPARQSGTTIDDLYKYAAEQDGLL